MMRQQITGQLELFGELARGAVRDGEIIDHRQTDRIAERCMHHCPIID